MHYAAREHHEIHFEKESPPPEFYHGSPFVPPNSADQGPPPNTIRDERQDVNNMPTTVDLGMLVPTTSNLEERLPPLLPAPKAVVFQDPRIARRREVGVVGFAARPVQPHELGRLDGPDACDAFCNASFLSLSFDVGGGGFMVPMLPKKGPFRTAEEAAEAQGMEVDWPTMFAILLAKFGEGTRLAQALLATGESFLLEHGADASGRIWHETCANRLGLQLMLIRDLLAPQKRREPDPNDPDVDLMTWTEFAKDICKFDIFSGEQDPAGMSSWQRAVKAATSKVLLHILAEVNRRSISSTSLED